MGRLVARFPDFGEIFEGRRMREFIAQLESLLQKVVVNETLPAYSITADATLGATDEVVLVDTSGGDVEVTFPEISDAMIRDKREFEVVKIEAAGTLFVTPSGSDTIMGEPDATITEQWTAIRFRATTGNWVAI